MIRLSDNARETLQVVAIVAVAFIVFGGSWWMLKRTWAEQDARKAAERNQRITEQRELDRRFRIVEQEPPQANQ